MPRPFALALLALFALAGSSYAQTPARQLPDEQVNKVLLMGLENLHKARCGAQPCAPATAEEKAKPPITLTEARLVMQRGALSGAAMHCALDWQKRNFLPMMAYWRQKERKNERQMALIGIVHGLVQGMAEPRANAPAHCPEELRRGLEARLTFAP